jgi:hypothetical protein
MENMTQLGNEALRWAKSKQESGQNIQFIVEALCEAMTAVAPEVTPLGVTGRFVQNSTLTRCSLGNCLLDGF